MCRRFITQKGQATVEYLVIFAGAVLAVSAGLMAFNHGLDGWWDQVCAALLNPGP